MRIYLNNQFVTQRRARVSVFDRGFLYGDGVFETLRAYNGRIFRLEDHLRRLKESARRLEIPLPYPTERLGRLLIRSLLINRLREASVRISISRGAGPVGLDPGPARRPTLVILPRAFRGYPKDRYRRGLKAAIVSVRRTPARALDPSIKSANFLNNILAEIEARKRKADEGIMLTLSGFLAEGSVSNLFIVKNRRLYTPGTDLGILAGITRQEVIRLARRAGIPLTEGHQRPSALYKADECFLTNTSMEVMPVVRADGIRIGNGKPGPVTRRLLTDYRDRVRSECGR